MAEDQEEYFHPQLNGVSGVRSPAKATKSKKKRSVPSSGADGPRGGANPYLQGLILGCVLLIPIGVWCWSKANEMQVPAAAPVEAEDAASVATAKANGKQATATPRAGNAAQQARKPVKPVAQAMAPGANSGYAPPPARITEFQPASSPNVSPGSSPEVVINQAPKVVDETEFEDKSPKKSVWKKIASPFRKGEKEEPPRSK